MGSDSSTIAIIVFCVIISAYFSAVRAAFSSVNKIRIKTLADGGDKRATLCHSLIEDYDRVSMTLLLCSVIANAAFSVLTAYIFIKRFDDGVSAAFAVVAAVFLLICEVTPKSLAKKAPEGLAMFSSPLINILRYILSPVTFLLRGWAVLMSKSHNTDEEQAMTDEELLSFMEEVRQDGVIDDQESEIIRNAIEFNEMVAEDILTPRVDITALEENASYEDARNMFIESGYSRLPVYRKTLDNIVGILHQKDLYEMRECDLPKIMKPPVYASPTMSIGALLKLLQQKKSHIAVVTDEFGGTMGIVTMEDILEELVGDIWDEHDEIVEDFQEIEPGKLKVNGATSIGELEDYLDIEIETEAATVSGWVIELLEKVPAEGDSIDYDGYNIVVTKVEERRVIEIIMTKLESEPEDED